MPYHIGSKGSNGCSGYPVVSDAGHVAGCHATESEATAQLSALYANVPDASKSETPLDVAYNPTVTDPIAATPNGIGMKRPQYMLNQPRQTQPKKIHNKPGVDIWSGSPFGKSNCCGDNIEKKSPCWDGYVQRGMKEGDNGQMVPNCVPVEKSEDNIMMPTPTYQNPDYSGCGCEDCMMSNTTCAACPKCNGELGKHIFDLNNAAKLVTKQTIRWSEDA